MAVAELPADRIDTIDDVSIEAAQCREQYRPALEMLLEDHGYDFAIRRAVLAEIANARPAEWAHAYALPHDLAMPRHLLRYSADDVSADGQRWSWRGRLRGEEAGEPYRIAGGVLYADLPAATLEYVSNAPDEARFPARFARALALELAARIVMPIKKDRARQGELMQLAEVARERAKAGDMNRDRESPADFVAEVQLARLGLGRA